VMVLPSLIGIKVLLFGNRGRLSRFFHLDFRLGTNMRHYRKNDGFAQVPSSVVTRAKTTPREKLLYMDAASAILGIRY
jgi:hypothetical protein